jgi:hypothetical protein
LLAVAVLAAIFVLTRTPRQDRDWVEHLAATPVVQMREDGFSVAPVTDWSYDADGPTAKQNVSFSASYADLRNVWFVLEPQPGGDYAAHTLVLFEFAGDRIVGLTVEARREAGEDYDPLLGLFNKYELAYVWSTAKELLNRRAVYLSKEVYIYPLQLTPRQEGDFLRSTLEATQALARRPRFYNTLTSNCTNELAKAARLDWHYSWVLTGYSPERLFELGLIPGDSPAAAKRMARLTEQMRRWNSAASQDFDRLLLTELRVRHPEGHAR